MPLLNNSTGEIRTDGQGQGLFWRGVDGVDQPLTLQREKEGQLVNVYKIEDLADIQPGEKLRAYTSDDQDSAVLEFDGETLVVRKDNLSPFEQVARGAADTAKALAVGAETIIDEESGRKSHEERVAEMAMDPSRSGEEVFGAKAAGAYGSAATTLGTSFAAGLAGKGGEALFKRLAKTMNKADGKSFVAGAVAAVGKATGKVPGGKEAAALTKFMLLPGAKGDKVNPAFVSAMLAEVGQVGVLTYSNVLHENLDQGVPLDVASSRAFTASGATAVVTRMLGGGALGHAFNKTPGVNKGSAAAMQEALQETGQEGSQTLIEGMATPGGVDAGEVLESAVLGGLAGHGTGGILGGGAPDIDQALYSNVRGEAFAENINQQVAEMPQKQVQMINDLIERGFQNKGMEAVRQELEAAIANAPIDEQVALKAVEDIQNSIAFYEEFRTSGQTIEEFAQNDEERENLTQMHEKVIAAAERLKRNDPSYRGFKVWEQERLNGIKNREEADKAKRNYEALTARGKHEEAQAQLKKAQRLDPSYNPQAVQAEPDDGAEEAYVAAMTGEGIINSEYEHDNRGIKGGQVATSEQGKRIQQIQAQNKLKRGLEQPDQTIGDLLSPDRKEAIERDRQLAEEQRQAEAAAAQAQSDQERREAEQKAVSIANDRETLVNANAKLNEIQGASPQDALKKAKEYVDSIGQVNDEETQEEMLLTAQELRDRLSPETKRATELHRQNEAAVKRYNEEIRPKILGDLAAKKANTPAVLDRASKVMDKISHDQRVNRIKRTAKLFSDQFFSARLRVLANQIRDEKARKEALDQNPAPTDELGQVSAEIAENSELIHEMSSNGQETAEMEAYLDSLIDRAEGLIQAQEEVNADTETADDSGGNPNPSVETEGEGDSESSPEKADAETEGTGDGEPDSGDQETAAGDAEGATGEAQSAVEPETTEQEPEQPIGDRNTENAKKIEAGRGEIMRALSRSSAVVSAVLKDGEILRGGGNTEIIGDKDEALALIDELQNGGNAADILAKIPYSPKRIKALVEIFNGLAEKVDANESAVQKIAVRRMGIDRSEFLKSYPGNETNQEWIDGIEHEGDEAEVAEIKRYQADTAKLLSENGIADVKTLMDMQKGLEAAQEQINLAREEMVDSNQGLVRSIANNFASEKLERQDLVQEGNIGLMKAIDTYDHRKAQFSTHATNWIKQAIGRAIENQGRTIRIPVHMKQKIDKLNRVSRELTNKLGREPTVEELAEAMELSVEEINDIRSVVKDATSLDKQIDDDGTTLGDIQADEDSEDDTGATGDIGGGYDPDEYSDEYVAHAVYTEAQIEALREESKGIEEDEMNELVSADIMGFVPMAQKLIDDGKLAAMNARITLESALKGMEAAQLRRLSEDGIDAERVEALEAAVYDLELAQKRLLMVAEEAKPKSRSKRLGVETEIDGAPVSMPPDSKLGLLSGVGTANGSGIYVLAGEGDRVATVLRRQDGQIQLAYVVGDGDIEQYWDSTKKDKELVAKPEVTRKTLGEVHQELTELAQKPDSGIVPSDVQEESNQQTGEDNDEAGADEEVGEGDGADTGNAEGRGADQGEIEGLTGFFAFDFLAARKQSEAAKKVARGLAGKWLSPEAIADALLSVGEVKADRKKVVAAVRRQLKRLAGNTKGMDKNPDAAKGSKITLDGDERNLTNIRRSLRRRGKEDRYAYIGGRGDENAIQGDPDENYRSYNHLKTMAAAGGKDIASATAMEISEIIGDDVTEVEKELMGIINGDPHGRGKRLTVANEDGDGPAVYTYSMIRGKGGNPGSAGTGKKRTKKQQDAGENAAKKTGSSRKRLTEKAKTELGEKASELAKGRAGGLADAILNKTNTQVGAITESDMSTCILD